MADYFSKLEIILDRLKADNFRSYDHYDFWGSQQGIGLRKNKSLLSLPFLAAAYAIDVLFPMYVRRGMEKKISMETLPYIMRSMLQFDMARGSQKYEADRKELLGYMIKNLGQSEHGRGVGHQFNWQTTTLIPAYTPCVTLSAYLVDYILEASGGADIPKEELDVLRDIGEFVFNDLNKTEHQDGAAKVTYTPLDNRYVINANSYAARIMRRLGKLFDRSDYLSFAKSLHEYVLSQQNDDGGWYYFEKGSVPDKENFIDCFHTAFVLENLIEWAEDGGNEKELIALEVGTAYFERVFINPDASVNHFAKSHLPIRIISDMRSSAEAMNFLVLISKKFPECMHTAVRVYYKAKEQMYDFGGSYFYFRRYPFHLSKMNYVRWATAPMLNAITNLALLTKEGRE